MSYAVICFFIAVSITQGNGGKAACFAGIHACLCILYNIALRTIEPQENCGFGEYLGIGLTMGDVVAVGNRIEKALQTDILENRRCVLAGRTDCQLIAPCAQLIQNL